MDENQYLNVPIFIQCIELQEDQRWEDGGRWGGGGGGDIASIAEIIISSSSLLVLHILL